MTVLEALPEFDQSPTVAFLHSQVLSLFTALPALLVSLVTGLGSNGVLDTVKTNCQKFLEAKLSHLFHAACALQHRSIHTNKQLDSNSSQHSDPERLFRHVRQLVQSGSLSAAYQCLTEPGLSQDDPYDHFVQIHRNNDLADLNIHNNIMQEVRETIDWEFFLLQRCVSFYFQAKEWKSF